VSRKVWGGLILVFVFAFAISLPFWINKDAHSEVPREDEVVVECAEFGLWRLMAADTETEFYELVRESDFWNVVELEDLDFRLLLGLEAEGIVLGADEDPFDKHKDYIAFKADFYRGMLAWGDLPPVEIMNTVEASKID